MLIKSVGLWGMEGNEMKRRDDLSNCQLPPEIDRKLNQWAFNIKSNMLETFRSYREGGCLTLSQLDCSAIFIYVATTTHSIKRPTMV